MAKPPVGSTVNPAHAWAPAHLWLFQEGSGIPSAIGTVALPAGAGDTPGWATEAGDAVTVWDGTKHADYGTGPLLAGKSKFTVVVSVKPTSITTTGGWLSKRIGHQNQAALSIGMVHTGSFGDFVIFDLGNQIDSSLTYGWYAWSPTGHWSDQVVPTTQQQLIFSYDGSLAAGQRVKLYRQGALAPGGIGGAGGSAGVPALYDAANLPVPSTTAPIWIAQGGGLDVAPGEFTGTMSYLYVIPDVAVSASEAASLFTTPFPFMVTSPLLTSIAHSAITATSATVTWITEVAASSRVEYGIGNFASAVEIATPVTSHTVPLPGLTPASNYQYRVKSTIAGPVTATSGGYAFTTLSAPASISPVFVDRVSTTKMRVSVTTDVLTTAVLDYGLTTGYGSQSTDATLRTSHRFSLTGLTANTAYHLRVTASTAAPVATTQTPDRTFSTRVADAAGPAAISDLAANIRIAQNGVRLRWTAPTDAAGRAASYTVKRSLATLTEGNFAAATTVTQTLDPQMAGGLDELVVSGLSASTTYFFAIKSTDAEGNVSAISNVASIATLAGRATMDVWGGDTRIQSPSGKNVGKTFSGTSTGLTATVLTDTTKSFPVGGLVGCLVCPDTTHISTGIRTLWYRIVSNTATSVTVNAADGSMVAIDPPVTGAPAAAVGDPYRISAVFSTELIGKQWWFITPEGNGFFSRGAALTFDKWSGSFMTEYPHEAIYLIKTGGTVTANLATQGVTGARVQHLATPDVVHATGETVHAVGDKIYIRSQRPFAETYFQMSQVGAGGAIQWSYSTAGGWTLLGAGTGHPDSFFLLTATFNGTLTATAADKSFNSAGGFPDAWHVGDTIGVGGFPGGSPNNGNWVIATITASKITVVASGIINQSTTGGVINRDSGVINQPWALDRRDVGPLAPLDLDAGIRVHWFSAGEYPSPTPWAKRVISVANGDGANTDGVSGYCIRGVVTTAFTTDPKVTCLFENSDPRMLLDLKYQYATVTPEQDLMDYYHSIGMTTAGYAGAYGDYAAHLVRHLPMYGGTGLTYYANTGTADAAKNIYENVPNSGSADIGVRWQFDMWEPALYAGVTAMVNTWPCRPNPNVIFCHTDEPDFMYGMSLGGTRTHMGYCIAASNPYRPTTWQGITATDKRFYGRYAFRDFLRYRYKPAAESLTAPSRSMSPPIYPYAGGANDATALANLNQAWATTYTTWGTSSGDLLTGTNAWGALGTGFMDEDGRHLVLSFPPLASDNPTSQVSYLNLEANVRTRAIYTDIRDFTALCADRYAYVCYDQMRVRTNNMLTPFLYDPAPEIAAVVNAQTDFQWTQASYLELRNANPAAREPAHAIDFYTRYGKPIYHENYTWAIEDSPLNYGGTVSAVSYNGGTNRTAITWTGKPITVRNHVVNWIRIHGLTDAQGPHAIIADYTGNTLYVDGDITAKVAAGSIISNVDPTAVAWGQAIGNYGTRLDLAASDRDEMLFPLINAQGPDGVWFWVGWEKWSYQDNPHWYNGENLASGFATPKHNFYDGVQAKRAVGLGAHNEWIGGEDGDYGDYVTTIKAALLSIEDTLALRTTAPVVPTFVSANAATWTPSTLTAFHVVTAASPPAAITLVSGALPSGVSLLDNGDGSAVIGGLNAVAGAFPVTLRATNSAGVTNQTFTLTISGAGSDTTPPTVTIQAPTSAPTHTTSTSPIAVTGIAADDVAVTSVTWANSAGGSGTATGTTSWTIPSVTLTVGSNVITVTAHDAAGNTGADVLTVTYALADTTPPTITITSPTASPTLAVSSPTIALSGTADDNVGVTSVTWANNRGGSGAATLT